MGEGDGPGSRGPTPASECRQDGGPRPPITQDTRPVPRGGVRMCWGATRFLPTPEGPLCHRGF